MQTAATAHDQDLAITWLIGDGFHQAIILETPNGANPTVELATAAEVLKLTMQGSYLLSERIIEIGGVDNVALCHNGSVLCAAVPGTSTCPTCSSVAVCAHKG